MYSLFVHSFGIKRELRKPVNSLTPEIIKAMETLPLLLAVSIDPAGVMDVYNPFDQSLLGQI